MHLYKKSDRQFDWDAIRRGANKLCFVHSDNDPYVPFDQAQYVANNCDVEVILIPGQGHFNLEKSKDYQQFPALLEIIKNVAL